jgi:hypothetical protein
VSRFQMEPAKVICISGKKIHGSLESKMASTNDRRHADSHRAQFETSDIPLQRELVDQNLMKLRGREMVACCWTWTAWGERERRGGSGNRDVQETQVSRGFMIYPLNFDFSCKRKIVDFMLKHRDLNPIASRPHCQKLTC